MHIRPAQIHEAQALAAIAWAAKASWGYSQSQLDAWREGLTPGAQSISAQPTYVAELEGVIAGFCQVNLSTVPIELEHLWVQPPFMRQGVGCALLAHVCAHLAGSGVESLHIDSDPNAEAFYVACGAVRIGVRAAPIEEMPSRVRPQLRLSTARTRRPTHADRPSQVLPDVARVA